MEMKCTCSCSPIHTSSLTGGSYFPSYAMKMRGRPVLQLLFFGERMVLKHLLPLCVTTAIRRVCVHLRSDNGLRSTDTARQPLARISLLRPSATHHVVADLTKAAIFSWVHMTMLSPSQSHASVPDANLSLTQARCLFILWCNCAGTTRIWIKS